MHKCASLSLLEVLNNGYPSYFVISYLRLFRNIDFITEGSLMLVLSQAYVVRTSMAQIDPQQYTLRFAEEHFATTNRLLSEFPFEVTNSICKLCKTIRHFMCEKIPDLERFAEILAEEEPDCAFQLLTATIDAFGESALPKISLILELFTQSELNQVFSNFCVALAKCQIHVLEQCSELICQRIMTGLSRDHPVAALNLLSNLPSLVITFHANLYTAVTKLATDDSIENRVAVRQAFFRLAQCTSSISEETVHVKMLQQVAFESSIPVRTAILEVLCDNVSEYLASPDCLKFFELLTL